MKKFKIKWSRKIIHIDMDAFFASVEERDHPEYKGKPIIVGGDPEGRGVVSTCSYEARKFGVHSAMPSSRAKRLCPQGIFLKSNFVKYEEASRIIAAILKTYTDSVEPASLDEAYLDVTKNRLSIEDPEMLAKLIKQHIFARTKLTASAGVAPSMFLAKIASDFMKPDGLTVISPEKVEDFLKDLPVRKIPGVGPKTEKVLEGMKIKTCSDVLYVGIQKLQKNLGKFGIDLYHKALGKDDRNVEPGGESAQLSTEETFPKDIKDISEIRTILSRFAKGVFYSLEKEGRSGKTIVLKVKYYDFSVITRSKTLTNPPDTWQIIYETACDLLTKKTLAGKKPIRLLGLGISGLKDLSEFQESAQKELF